MKIRSKNLNKKFFFKIKFHLFRFINNLISKILIFFFRNKKPKLPEIFFLFGTIFFPQMNVELIIRDQNNKTLFLWRDDHWGNKGWHLPGGIIRPNEKIIDRVKLVLDTETNIKWENATITGPISFSEVIYDKPGIRSHFNSLVYLVVYKGDFYHKKFNQSKYEITELFDIPKFLIKNHKRYIKLLKLRNETLALKKITLC